MESSARVDNTMSREDGDPPPEDRNLLEGGAAARIRALDELTASSIRKCQVINKVSDIVRELVENSLDAGSTTVQVYLEKFGANKIEVRDNGHGLQSSDITHIFQGGYTSKLQDTSNLSRGNFFGFKGEALNAMCAAGNVTVVSKIPNELTASKYKFDFLGNVISEARVAHGKGTTVTVEKLFESIRVRRQMVENESKGANDLKEIEAYLKGVAVANPNCHLSLYHNTSSVWSKPSVQTVAQALFAVFGHNIAKRLERVGPMTAAVTENRKGHENNVATTIEMYLPKNPVDMRTMSFTSNKLAMIFCNRKRVYIREFEKLIHRYVTSVVEKPQPSDQRRFPIFVLCINVPPTEADFNRNMDKTKVFLVNKVVIREAVEDALSKFYGINLRESAVEAAPSKTNADKNVDQNEAQKLKDKSDDNQEENETNPIGAPILPSTSSFKHGCDRESTIGSFLQNIPSTSSAFTQSPSKAPNTEPVVVEFPVSKRKVDLNADHSENTIMQMDSIKKPRGGCVVANFEISIDSQELEFEENGEKTDTSKAEINLNSRDLSTVTEERGAKEFQNWLQGTITDKYGDIIENVRAVNEIAKDCNQSTERERFRSALVTSTPVPSRANRSSISEQPISSFFSPLQPAPKRPRNDPLENHPLVVVPPPAALLCQTPRMLTPTRQVTLHSLANWPTSTGAFSQVASRAGVGVRIPLTPTAPKLPANTPGSYFSNPPKSNQNVVPKLATPRNEDADKESRRLPSTYSVGKLTPKIHKEFEGSLCGQIYIAQTFDSVGIFSPLKMIEYFPDESRECWSPTTTCQNTFENETLSLTFEDVSRMFQQFCTRSEINCTPVSRKIFHALSKLPDLTVVIN